MAVTMQPDLPWNVAGIAPEAREAARTSARREGLSVGEWLTRRILRGLPEAGTVADEWWLGETSHARTPSNENPGPSGYQRNEDRLQKFLPQPNATRNGHAESRNALNDAAAQIKFANRDGSEKFEQFAERIVRLDARLARIEVRAAAEDAKHAETIKSLQAKAAELAEQISKTASRGTTQSKELAKAIEGIAEKFLQSSDESEEQRSAMNERIAAIAESTGLVSEKLEQSRWENERQYRAVDDRVAAMEHAIERTARDADAVDRLEGSFDQLTRRFETTEAEYLHNVERFENRLTRMEANPGEAVIDRRLQSIEQTLADMSRLIEKNARETPALSEAGQSDVPERVSRAEASDRRPGAVTANTSETGSSAAAFGKAPAPQLGSLAASSAPDLRESAHGATAPDESPRRPVTAAVESSLAAARNAHEENSSPPRDTSFSRLDGTGQSEATEAPNTRLILLGGIGFLVLAAIGTGFYLSNNLSRTTAIPHLVTIPAHHPVVATTQKPEPVRVRPVVTQVAANHVATRSHAVAAPTHLPPPANAMPASSRAKALTPLQRLAPLAGAGNAKAQEVLGLAYLDGDGLAVNEAEGAKWLERAAARGEAVAAYRLGTLYERGHGVAVDHAKAARWYMAAAKVGNRKAMHNLAVAYAQGTGVKKDTSLAAQWFLRAANLGLADSQFDLAVLYERGLGVPQSLAAAYRWYAIASAQGDAESRARMEAIASQISAVDKAAAEKAAAGFRPAPLESSANAPPIAASLVGG
jgi:localization factor PodJL